MTERRPTPRSAGAQGPAGFSALNDLGVLAARAGERGKARRALEASLALAPDYDLAAWNLGVLFLNDWPRGIPTGQAYLARAIRRNSSLATAPVDYRTDERIYRHTFRADPAAPVNQTAGPSLTTATLQVATVASAAAAAGLRETVTKAVESLRDKFLELFAALQTRVRRSLRRGGARRLRRLASVGYPWLLTGIALAGVAAWSAWSTPVAARSSVVTAALFAVLVAVLAHECAHAVAAWRGGFWVKPISWTPGIVLALLLLPFRLSSGPYVGHRVQPAAPPARAWWIVLAGPAANLALAVVAYGLYRVEPLPVLRLVAQTQLLILGFTILPFKPLDGAVLVRRHRWLVGGLGAVVGVGAAALGLGKL